MLISRYFMLEISEKERNDCREEIKVEEEEEEGGV